MKKGRGEGARVTADGRASDGIDVADGASTTSDVAPVGQTPHAPALTPEEADAVLGQ
jgi:hypothetical protein